ncbi:MAG: hypothetical protein B7X40_01495 [Cellulomonas sp. 14-74-6]|nr:MAG: hypothetical protein B7X40_01495 [Cellulomonas sp. 14-74-6]
MASPADALPRSLAVPVAARRARIAISAAFAAQGLSYALTLNSLPVLERRHGVGTGQVTVVILGVSLVAASGTVLADRLAASASGSRGGLVAGLSVLAAALVGVAAAPSFAVLVGAFLLYGLGLGLVDASVNMQAVAVQHRYGRSLLAGFHGAWSFGGIAGALLVAALAPRWPADPVVAVILLGTPAAVAAAVLVQRTGWWSGGPAAVAAGAAAAEGTEAAPMAADGAESPTAGPGSRAVVPWRPVLMLGLVVVAFYIVDSAVSAWSALFLAQDVGAPTHVQPLGYAAYLGTTLLSRVVGDLGVRRIGRAAVVRVGAVLGTVGLLVVMLTHDAWLVVAGFGLVGLGLGVVPPLSFSAAGDVAPGHADAVVARLNYFNYVGVVLGGVAVGAVGSVLTLRAGFVVPAALVLAVVLVARVLGTPGGRGPTQPPR